MDDCCAAGRDVDELCLNVNSWLALQAEVGGAAVASLQQELRCLDAGADAAIKIAASMVDEIAAASGAASPSSSSSPKMWSCTKPGRASQRVRTDDDHQIAASSTLPAPRMTPRSPASECKPLRHSFPAIETVLASRQRRAKLSGVSRPLTLSGSNADQSSPLPLPQPSADPCSSPPRSERSPAMAHAVPTPPAEMPSITAVRPPQLQRAFAYWRCNVQGPLIAIPHLLIDRAVSAAPSLALTAALRQLRRRTRLAGESAVRADAGRRLGLSALWRRLREGIAFASSMAQRSSAARSHAAVASRRRVARLWASRASQGGNLERRAAAHADVRRQRGLDLSFCFWHIWLRRQVAWRGRARRRAEAHGGWLVLHRSAMRAFDRRAVFVEEGSAVMANRYRDRRHLAWTFCRWLETATTERRRSGEQSRDHSDGPISNIEE